MRLVLVDLVGIHLESSSGIPVLLLREHDAPHRVLPIFIGGAEATAIALAVSGQTTPRPLTHDVMASIVESEVERFHDFLVELEPCDFLSDPPVQHTDPGASGEED